MFFHHYFTRIKCLVRDRETMFWTLLFPILLGTLFFLALSNIGNFDDFEKFDIAIVFEEENQETESFLETAEETELFNITLSTRGDALELLETGAVEGIIIFNAEPELIVNQSNLNQTILKSFLDQYLQVSATISTIVTDNPQAISEGLIDNISTYENYIEDTTGNVDILVNYFYSLIAMTCFFGGFLALKEVTALQADLSDVGLRVNLSPTSKLKLLMASMLAATTIQLLIIGVLLCYLIFVLSIDFGDQIGYVLLTAFVGSMTGVSFGAFIAAAVKKGEGIKNGILIGFTMSMSFLSGMMFDQIKYIVATKAPILSYLNPVSLITDSFYALYCYSTHTQFFINIILLCGFTVLFSTIAYLIIRRQKYASL